MRLTPKAARDEVVGVESHRGATVLRARVRALPEGGGANDALERLIAGWLNVPPSSVKVVQGARSRLKQVAIDGEPERLASAVAARLAALAG